MKDLSISLTNIPTNRLSDFVEYIHWNNLFYFKSNSIDNSTCNINNITNSLSHMVQPYSSSAGWGVYGDQQTWADLHLR